MGRSASRRSPPPSPPSRISRRRRPARTRSAGGHTRSPLRVLWTVHTALVLAAVVVAAASAHVVGAAEETLPITEGALLKTGLRQPPRYENVTAQIRDTTGPSSDSISSGRRRRRRTRTSADTRRELSSRRRNDCDENPFWSRRVDVANYEYGCNEIEVSVGCGFQMKVITVELYTRAAVLSFRVLQWHH